MTDIAPETVAAIANTLMSPSAPIIVEDLLLAHKLAVEVREKLAGKPASLSLIFQTIFSLM